MDNKESFIEQNEKKFKELKTDSSSTNLFLLEFNKRHSLNFDDIKREFNIEKFENINKERTNRFKEFLEKFKINI